MRPSNSNLLRRTFAVFGLLGAVALIPTSALAQTAVLSGASGNFCNYSQMTVTPNGSITITCTGGGVTAPPPGAANFALTGPATMVTNSRDYVTVTRSGTSPDPLTVRLSVSGGGCNNGYADLTFGATDPPMQVLIITFGDGSCTVSLTPPPGGHTANPGSLAITVGTGGGSVPSGGGGTTTPPGCPAPATGSLAHNLTYGPVDQLRMKSNVIAYYPVIPQPDMQYASVEFTQGQQPVTPGQVVTEFTVSQCPGVIDSNAGGCYYKSGGVNSNKIVIYTRPKPEWGWNTQADVNAYGCLADASKGAWYVNVRWTFATCAYGEGACGFSMQWALGAW
jgi:hypothetical protein